VGIGHRTIRTIVRLQNWNPRKLPFANGSSRSRRGLDTAVAKRELYRQRSANFGLWMLKTRRPTAAVRMSIDADDSCMFLAPDCSIVR